MSASGQHTCAFSTLSKMVCLMLSPAAYLASVIEKNEVFMVSPISSLHSRICFRICISKAWSLCQMVRWTRAVRCAQMRHEKSEDGICAGLMQAFEVTKW